jgi:hypothetical protein
MEPVKDLLLLLLAAPPEVLSLILGLAAIGLCSICRVRSAFILPESELSFMALKAWVRLPPTWIESGGLNKFRWANGDGADGAAGLMVLMIIAHHADEQHGIARVRTTR